MVHTQTNMLLLDMYNDSTPNYIYILQSSQPTPTHYIKGSILYYIDERSTKCNTNGLYTRLGAVYWFIEQHILTAREHKYYATAYIR